MSSQARQIIRGLASAVGLVILFYSVDASDAQMKAFFPKRPAGVTVSHLRGVLVDYGIGNASGGFTVVDGNGKRVDFYTAWPMYIDGRPVKCSIAPTETFKPDPRYCPDWPSNIRLGYTKVEVIYWSSARDGEPVLVSDEIRKLP